MEICRDSSRTVLQILTLFCLLSGCQQVQHEKMLHKDQRVWCENARGVIRRMGKRLWEYHGWSADQGTFVLIDETTRNLETVDGGSHTVIGLQLQRRCSRVPRLG